MSFQIAELAVSAISAFAAILQAWQAVKSTTRPSQQVIDRVLKRPPGPPRDLVVSMDKVIPDNILKSIAEKLERAKKRFSDALKDPRNTPQDIQKEEEVATLAICEELNRIKRLNEGSLPPEYEKLWSSFRCVA